MTLGAATLADITALSDDENVLHPSRSSNDPPVEIFARRRRKCRKRIMLKAPLSSQPLREQLLRIVQMKCRCAQTGRIDTCFRSFRNDEPAISELIQLRMRLKELHKQDSDEEARATILFLLSPICTQGKGVYVSPQDTFSDTTASFIVGNP